MKGGLETGGSSGDEDCTITGTLTGFVKPYVQVDGKASVGVDVVLAAVKIKGKLLLLQLAFPLELTVALEMADAAIHTLTLDVDLVSKLTIKSLDGKLSLYGRLGICPFCLEGEVKIFGWTGVGEEWILFETGYDVNLASLLYLLLM